MAPNQPGQRVRWFVRVRAFAALVGVFALSAMLPNLTAWVATRQCAVIGMPSLICGPPALFAPKSLAGQSIINAPWHSLRARVASQRQATSDSTEEDLITTDDLKKAAARLNVELREEVSGPWYQMALYSNDRQVGKTSGWAQPWGTMHLETIEVRRFTGYWVEKPVGGATADATSSAEGEEKGKYADVSKVARWFGLLLAVSIACWNRERSPFYCKEAQLLAIKDEEKQHERLVRYYRQLGFQTIRDNEELTLQDQIFWGGEGTLMSVDAEDFLRKWTPVVRALGRDRPQRPRGEA